MAYKKLSLFAVTVVSTWVLTGTPAQAQDLDGGGLAHENINGVRTRAPGIMITRGIVRAQQMAARGRAGPNITEPEDEDPSRSEQFVSDSLTLVFDQIRAFVAFFGNQLATRAGLAPLFNDDGTAIDAGIGLLDDLLGSGADDSTDTTPDDTSSDVKTDSRDTTDDGGPRTLRKINRIQ